MALEDQDDAALLASADGTPEAFGVFYRRHLPWVLRFLRARVASAELAADLAGEVFASALRARHRFDPGAASAEPWLQAIARNTLTDSLRRGQVEARARRALGISVLELTDDDLARVEELVDQSRGDTPATQALADLPPDQLDAVHARVLEDEPYAAIAHRLRCSEAVVRQRVSRGLRAMREKLLEER